MSILFKAKTTHGIIIKVLIEILHNNFKKASFKINNDGISSIMYDTNKTRMINIVLEKSKFNYYKFDNDEDFDIGFNIDQLNKMIRTVKKNDSVALYIYKDKPYELYIDIENNDSKNKRSTIRINTFLQKNIVAAPLTGYENAININSNDFQKICKEFSAISNVITITNKGFILKFSANNEGICTRETTFGNNEDDEEEFDEYTEEFDSDSLIRITKIASLNNNKNLQIFIHKDRPILFKTVFDIGEILIFIKCRKMIKN